MLMKVLFYQIKLKNKVYFQFDLYLAMLNKYKPSVVI